MAEEKNTPFAVRMDTEDKAKLLKLIEESGAESNKEFMNALMSAYELNKVKIEIPEASESIKKVEELTQLINDYFIGMSKQIKITKESMNLQFTKDTEVYTKRIEVLKNENEQLDEKLAEATMLYNTVSKDYGDSVKDIKGLNEQIEQLNKNLNDKDIIIEEFKEKNDTLTGLVNEYKGYKVQIDEYKTKIEESQALNLSLVSESESKGKEITVLSERLDREKEELNTRHSEELAREREKAAFERDKALLDQERKYQEALNNLNEQHNEKVKSLLEELEHGRKARTSTKTGRAAKTDKTDKDIPLSE